MYLLPIKPVAACRQQLDQGQEAGASTHSSNTRPLCKCAQLAHSPERGCAGTKQSYMEQEEVVNQQLSQLIRDAVWLKSYLASVMRLAAEAFHLAQQALGPQQTAPPPVCPLLALRAAGFRLPWGEHRVLSASVLCRPAAG